MKFEKMKFYENFREFTKKMIAKNYKMKMWKKRDREKRGFEKIFWTSWEKRVNFKWFDPLSKRIFRDSRNENIFVDSKKFEEIFEIKNQRNIFPMTNRLLRLMTHFRKWNFTVFNPYIHLVKVWLMLYD